MKAYGIYKQYLWLADTIRRARHITLSELNERWTRTEMSQGQPLSRSTFNRHREAIEDMFELCIGCRRMGNKHYYYIEQTEGANTDNLQHWGLDSLSVGNLLMENTSLKDRILLEDIPSGKEYLSIIIEAMKLSCKLEMTYHKFGQKDSYTYTVEPYAIKVFKQRWYMLAKSDKRPEPSIYALDRIVSLHETTRHFDYPSHFDTEAFFKDYYGVLCNPTEAVETIRLRAYPPFMHYLRTLPLHHSQREVESTPQYADFEFRLRPTFDFCQELLAQSHEVEVLKPMHLRKRLMLLLSKNLQQYARGLVE